MKKRIILTFIILPFVLFCQNKKNSFLIIYPEKISTDETLQVEKIEYLNYEKNRSLNNPYGKINKKLKEEIENLTIEKIIGNVTRQSLEYYLYENFPKNKYQITERNIDYEIEKCGKNKKSDYVFEYNNLVISENENGKLQLDFELVLFDIKNKEYLIKKEFIATENNQGGMWGCSESRFTCIITNTIRIGTSGVAKIFWKK